MKDNILFVGLDFETSTGDAGLAPIQIGLVVGDQTFESLIGGWTFNGDPYLWSMESQKIHNIEQGLLVEAPDIFMVDIFATAWLLPLVKGTQRMNRIAMGWNVGSFDRQIVKNFMPNLNKVLSYRTCDLNTVCYVVATQLDASFEKLKKDAKTYSAAQIGLDVERWHDALYDAQAGMYQWSYLTSLGVTIEENRIIKGKILGE